MTVSRAGPTAVRRLVVWAARRLGYDVWRIPTRAAGRQWRDAEYYRPFFSPWLGYGDFAAVIELAGESLVPPDRLYVLWVLSRNAPDGETWECGVYKGGTARVLASVRGPVRLFDTFGGLPDVDETRDLLRPGAMAASPPVIVGATIHAGLIPDTFVGLEDSRIAFAHVDVDLYRSVRDCCEFIYPRLSPGGVMVFDDYGGQTTPGARAAVDEFFADKPEVPLVLASSQAIVFKAPPTGSERSPS